MLPPVKDTNMKAYVLLFLLQQHCLIIKASFFHTNNNKTSDNAHIGYQLTVAIPTEYSRGFVGRAFLMETAPAAKSPLVNFRAAVSVEAVEDDKKLYTCSLDVFLGEDVKVWSSGHLSPFYAMGSCTLELTQNGGDLQLKGARRGGRAAIAAVGWHAGTSGQGVQKLKLLRTGNLVLMDSKNTIKWQSFNFPTNTMLWGQRLSPMTRLTSFPISNSSPSFYYSLEIHDDKLALYFNSGNWKYSYWEYKPSNNRNITYARLTSQGLEIYNGVNWRITQITSKTPQEPPKFLALADATGNLGLYYYSPQKQVFEASYEAINNTCYLPFACNKSYDICTSSGECSCIRLVKRGLSGLYCCNEEMLASGSCDKSRLGMLELHGITTILNSSSKKVNLTKAACADSCLNNCTCVAAMYGDAVNREGECYFYGLVRGVKQMGDDRERKMSYMVKVPKDVIDDCHGKACRINTWVLVVAGIVDGLVILILSVGIGYCVVQRRKNNIPNVENN